MKYAIITVLLLPLFSAAQTENVVPALRNEIGISAGNSLDLVQYFGTGAGVKCAATFLRNFSNIQAGISIEAGTGTADNWYFAPTIIANYKFSNSPSYFYMGAATGFVMSGYTTFDRRNDFPDGKGYTLGLQGGYLHSLNNRWAFNAEVSVRSMQVWVRDYYYKPSVIATYGYVPERYMPITRMDFSLSIPVTVGFRYRF